MVYHIFFFSVSYYSNIYPYWFESVSSVGYIGVDFFFVISGFVILNAHYDDKSGVSSLVSFSFKRIIRIYPPYLPIAATAFFIYYVNPNIGNYPKDNIGALSTFLLIPSLYPTSLIVAWTLIHEMVFYLIFLTYFISRRFFIAVIGAWVVVIAANAVFSPGLTGNLIFYRFLATINLEFAFGLICACVWRRLNVGPAVAASLLLGGVISLAMILSYDVGKHRWLFAIPFSLILLGGCYLEKTGALNVPRLLLLLGDASYAIYLIHLPLISVMFRAVPAINRHTAGFNPTTEWAMTASAVIITGILASVMYHKLYERPIIHFLHRKTSSFSGSYRRHRNDAVDPSLSINAKH